MQVGALRLFGSGPLTVFRDNKDDPYLTLPESDEDSEREDFVIRPTDHLILAARTEDEVSHLEVWVHEACHCL